MDPTNCSNTLHLSEHVIWGDIFGHLPPSLHLNQTSRQMSWREYSGGDVERVTKPDTILFEEGNEGGISLEHT